MNPYPMKKITAVITALSVGAVSSGCTFGASIDTLMTPPKLSSDQEQIYSALTKSLGTSNISLKYPKSGKYLSAFIIEDIDGDGGDEALVFYERNNHAADENPLRIKVLEKEDGQWSSAYDISAAGSEIEEVMISRLGNNDRVNLIIGTSLINRSEKTVSIYVYSDGKLLEPPEFSDNKSYAYIDVTDLDLDGQYELLRLLGASGEKGAVAETFKLDESGEYTPSYIELSDKFSDFDISYGKVGDSEMGVYLDALSGTGSVQTDVLYMKDGALHKVFGTAEESKRTSRPAGCTCFDVDGDGSIEIPVQTTAPGYGDSLESAQMKLTDWMQIGSEYKFKKRYTSYYSVNDGYIFVFPEKWVGKVTVRRDTVNDEIVFCEYSNGEMGRELLRIFCAGDVPSREDRLSGGYMLMHTKGETAYLAFIPQSVDTEGDGLSITMGDAAVGFRYRD